jgi:tryptophan synthase alpha chain
VSRLASTFARLRGEGRKALVSFVTAGDPSPAVTVPALHALVRGGVDVLELGMPFSDPEAEGPSIQASSERALRAGTRLADVFEIVRRFRADDANTPIVLMGYLNALERVGYRAFAARAAASGVDGTIIVNLPPEEAEALRAAYRAHGLDSIFLVAPTTSSARLERIAAVAQGFVYYVSLKGVTGANHLVAQSVPERVAAIRAVTDLPVVVGFGIKDAATAAAVAPHADGIVVGSALVDTMARLTATPEAIPPALTAQAEALRRAIDRR